MSLMKYLPYLECFWNKEKLFEVTFFVTNKCNFKCSFCFNDSKSDIMTIEQIEEMAKKLGPFCRLLISGGEPFMRSDLAEICRIFIEHCKVSHITIPTNGYFSGRIADFVRELCPFDRSVTVNISLSLDEIYENRDSLVGMKQSFERLKETASYLEVLKRLNKNLLVGTITTQCPENELRLYQVYNYAKRNLQLDYFSFNRARGTKFNKNIYRRFTRFLLKNQKDKVGIPFYPLKKKLVFDAVLNEPDFKCYSGGLRKVISSDGKVYPCETIMFGGKCPCWHECDLATNLIFGGLNGRQK